MKNLLSCLFVVACANAGQLQVTNLGQDKSWRSFVKKRDIVVNNQVLLNRPVDSPAIGSSKHHHSKAYEGLLGAANTAGHGTPRHSTHIQDHVTSKHSGPQVPTSLPPPPVTQQDLNEEILRSYAHLGRLLQQPGIQGGQSTHVHRQAVTRPNLASISPQVVEGAVVAPAPVITKQTVSTTAAVDSSPGFGHQSNHHHQSLIDHQTLNIDTDHLLETLIRHPDLVPNHQAAVLRSIQAELFKRDQAAAGQGGTLQQQQQQQQQLLLNQAAANQYQQLLSSQNPAMPGTGSSEVTSHLVNTGIPGSLFNNQQLIGHHRLEDPLAYSGVQRDFPSSQTDKVESTHLKPLFRKQVAEQTILNRFNVSPQLVDASNYGNSGNSGYGNLAPSLAQTSLLPNIPNDRPLTISDLPFSRS